MTSLIFRQDGIPSSIDKTDSLNEERERGGKSAGWVSPPFEEGFFSSPVFRSLLFPKKKCKGEVGGGYPLVEMDRKKRINSGHVPEGREALPLPPFFPFAAC